jgi:hypothetical protein
VDVCPLGVLCVLSGRGLCDGLITRPEESYRLWCVLVCDQVTSGMRTLKLARVVKCQIEKKKVVKVYGLEHQLFRRVRLIATNSY